MERKKEGERVGGGGHDSTSYRRWRGGKGCLSQRRGDVGEEESLRGGKGEREKSWCCLSLLPLCLKYNEVSPCLDSEQPARSQARLSAALGTPEFCFSTRSSRVIVGLYKSGVNFIMKLLKYPREFFLGGLRVAVWEEECRQEHFVK